MSVNSPLLRVSSPKVVTGQDSNLGISDGYVRYSLPPPSPLPALNFTYMSALLAQGIATTLTIASIYYPGWFRGRTIGQVHVHYSYVGLDDQCLYEHPCTPFPMPSDCRKYGDSFCAAWQSSAFSMWIALVLETTSEFALFCIIFIGNKQVLHTGWKLITILLGASIIFQFASTITLAILLETSFRGDNNYSWSLGSSWAFATISWVLGLFIIMGLAIVGIMSRGIDDECDDLTEIYDNDSESITTDGTNGEGEPRDDFYYYDRRTRRNYLACNS